MPSPMHIAYRAAGACALALALFSPVQAAPVLGVSTQATATGIDLTVNVRDVVDLYGYQFTLNFEPGSFTFLSSAEGAFLPGAGATFFDGGTLDSTAGSLSFVFATLIGPGSGASGSGDLARFSFGIGGDGPADFRFTDVVFVDSIGNDIPVLVGDPANAVPEPGSLWLTGLGISALLGGRAARVRARRIA